MSNIRSARGAASGLPRNASHDQLIDKVNDLNKGHINARIDVTLRANQTTTTLTDHRIGPNSVILQMPQTAHAATAYVAGIYVTNRIKGSCTLNHASSANTDQTFCIAIIGS